MAPPLVLEDETPLMALGSPGSNAIIAAIAQVLLHHHTFRLTPLEAAAYPRVHAEGEEALLEGRIPSRIGKGLLEEGFQVNVAPRNYEPRMRRVQLIYRGREEGRKVWKGVSDPRRDGGVTLKAEG